MKRTLPPAAAPIQVADLLNGCKGLLRGSSEVEKFKADLKKYYRLRHCFLTSSGKAALTVILQALYRISPDRSEVLIPAYTCYSVPSAIVRAGLRVRLADMDPDSLDYDLLSLENSLKNKDSLLAVICPHLFGYPANIKKIREIVDDPQIAIIEDAAQAMDGVDREGCLLGTLGDVGFFSLGRGKAFSTVEGGVIITDSDRLAREIDFFLKKIIETPRGNYLMLAGYALALGILTDPKFFWLPKSIPHLKLGETIYDPQFSMKPFTPFQAGLARNWRKRIAAYTAVRKKNVSYWTRFLSKFSWLKPIYDKNQFTRDTLPLLRFPVLVREKSLCAILLKQSNKHGLGIMPAYPDSIDKINGGRFAHRQYFPGAEECVHRLVTFPVHSFVSQKDQQKIVACLEAIKK